MTIEQLAATTPILGLPYPTPTDPVSGGADAIKNLALAIDPKLGSYGTSLPASPVDGQVHTLVDSVTNPAWVWRFRYNASSSSAYKWEFIGGSAWTLALSPWTVTGPDAWQYPGLGSFSCPRAGDYDAALWGRGHSPAGGSFGWAAVAVNGAAWDGESAGVQTSTASRPQAFYTRRVLLGMNVGTTFQSAFKCPSGGNLMTFEALYLSVLPRRVA